MLAVFFLIDGFFLIELVGGLLTNSLALLSDAGPMFTDVLGIGVAFRLLRESQDASLNVKGACLEVIADLLALVGVVTAAAILLTTGLTRADPIFAIGIGLFILPRAWKLGGKALRVLIQAAPDDIDVASLNTELEALDGVADVHDLHAWTLTSRMDVASVHLGLQPGADSHDTLDQARALLRTGHHIDHATIQVEPDERTACNDRNETNW